MSKMLLNISCWEQQSAIRRQKLTPSVWVPRNIIISCSLVLFFHGTSLQVRRDEVKERRPTEAPRNKGGELEGVGREESGLLSHRATSVSNTKQGFRGVRKGKPRGDALGRSWGSHRGPALRVCSSKSLDWRCWWKAVRMAQECSLTPESPRNASWKVHWSRG